MEINQLYGFVLLLVLVGMVLGVGILVLDKFMSTTGISTTAITAINATIVALSSIATSWLALIVTIAVLSIIMVLVIRSFGSMRGR